MRKKIKGVLKKLSRKKAPPKKPNKKIKQTETNPIWNCIRELILKGDCDTAFITLDDFFRINKSVSEDIMDEVLSVFIFCIKTEYYKELIIFYKKNEHIRDIFISFEKEKILMEKIIDRSIKEHDLKTFLDIHHIMRKEPRIDDKIHFFDQCIIDYSKISVTDILNIIEHMLRSKIIDEHKKTEFIKEVKEKATEQKQHDIVSTIDDMISNTVSLSLFEGE